MSDIINVNRAITLWPEWAYAVLHLGKDVENRPWTIPPGLYALHAGKHIGGKPGAAAQARGLAALRSTAGTMLLKNDVERDFPTDADLLAAFAPMKGCIVGVIEVINTPGKSSWRPSMSAWAGRDAIDPGTRWEWRGQAPTIANPIEVRHVAASPIPWRGQLGLWFLSDRIVSQVNAWPLEFT